MPCLACGQEQPQAPGQTGVQVFGKQLCSEGPGDPDGHQAPLEPAKVNLAAKRATAFHAALARALPVGLSKVLLPLH